jgi:hypothetical protein
VDFSLAIEARTRTYFTYLAEAFERSRPGEDLLHPTASNTRRAISNARERGTWPMQFISAKHCRTKRSSPYRNQSKPKSSLLRNLLSEARRQHWQNRGRWTHRPRRHANYGRRALRRQRYGRTRTAEVRTKAMSTRP